jgi:hypothetical protein
MRTPCPAALPSIVVLVVLVNSTGAMASGYKATILHPRGFYWTSASGMSDGSQVGTGLTTDGIPHALLWSGTAESVVDLNPVGFGHAHANGVSGASQVGVGLAPDATGHALCGLVRPKVSSISIRKGLCIPSPTQFPERPKWAMAVSRRASWITPFYGAARRRVLST